MQALQSHGKIILASPLSYFFTRQNGQQNVSDMDIGMNYCYNMDDSENNSNSYVTDNSTDFSIDDGTDSSIDHATDFGNNTGDIFSNDELDNSSTGENDSENKQKRQSYTREFKIYVLDWHRKNGSIKNKTARHFDLTHQNVLRWVRSEVQIRSCKKGAKSQGSGRPAIYPLLERELYKEFLELREKGIKIRTMWFTTR